MSSTHVERSVLVLAVVLSITMAAITPSSLFAVQVAHYNLNEGNGNTALDSSGFGNNGSIVGAIYTTENPPPFPAGSSLEFVGASSDRVVIPDAAILRPATSVTIEAWVRLRSVVGPNSNVIVGKQIGDGADSYVLLAGGPGPNLGSAIFSANDGANQVFVVGPHIDDNEWHYVVGELRAGNLEIYVDSELTNSTPFPNAIAYDGNPVTIGNDLNGVSWVEGWNGVIDEVKINDVPVTLGTDDPSGSAPASLALEHSLPNPFHLATTSRFYLPEAGAVSLRVFDTSGRLVRVLLDDHRNAGAGHVTWDGRDHQGERVPAGVYFYRFRAGDQVLVQKVVRSK
jgi:hypothetical protein